MILLSSVVYISLDNKVRIRVDNEKVTFYTKNDNNRFVVSGREYNKLFDGTKLMYRSAKNVEVDTYIDNISNTVTIKRTTPFIRGPTIVDTYFFDGKIDDLILFPIYHKVEIFNAKDKFYRYEVRDLEYDGPSIKLNTTSMSFGKNMKVNWQSGYNWARVYKTGILKVQYKIKSDYEVFNVRLFDPPTDSNLANFNQNYTLSPKGQEILNFTATVKNQSWLEFDGVNDYVTNNSFSPLLNSTSLSLSVWFNGPVNKTESEWNAVLNASTLLWFQDNSPLLKINRYNYNIQLYFMVYNSSGSSTFLTYNIDDNTTGWHHLLATFNQTNKNMTMYYDNVLVGNKTATDNNVPSGNSFGIGKDDNVRYFRGGIDEVRIYNVSLSPSQINEIYNSGRQANVSLPSNGLISWYSFNAATGTIVYDKIGDNDLI